MREIKFRAWDTSLSQMFYSEGATLREIIEASNECEDEWWFDEGEDILMQFTGLLDKADTEIYEGDILQGKYGEQSEPPTIEQYRAVVEWYRGSFKCFSKHLSDFITNIGRCEVYWVSRHHRDPHLYWAYEIKDIEVIGNVHENPELLEEHPEHWEATDE